METIGIFFGSNTGKSEKVANLIKAELSKSSIQVHNIRFCAPSHFEKYDTFIIVTSTWGNGDLQDDWVEFDRFIDQIDFSQKTLAFVGLGDQETYPDTFSDGIGLLYGRIAHKAANVIGETDIEGYQFQKSKAVLNDKFIGLILDEDNQADLTKKRISQWVNCFNSI